MMFLNMNRGSDSPEDLTEKKTGSMVTKRGLTCVGKERKKVMTDRKLCQRKVRSRRAVNWGGL